MFFIIPKTCDVGFLKISGDLCREAEVSAPFLAQSLKEHPDKNVHPFLELLLELIVGLSFGEVAVYKLILFNTTVK